MKKNMLFTLLISISLLMLFIGVLNDNKNEYLINGFTRWGNGEFTEIEGHKFFCDFQEYLSNNPKITNEDIWNISKQLNILEYNGLRVIEYIESPDKYGNSGKLSYHLLQYKGLTVPMNYGGSFHVYDITQKDENTFYIYGYDYRFSNETGLTIFKALIRESDSSVTKNIIHLDNGSSSNSPKFNLFNDSLYYGGGHINIKKIGKKDFVISIEINDSEFYLKLNDEGIYNIEFN